MQSLPFQLKFDGNVKRRKCSTFVGKNWFEEVYSSVITNLSLLLATSILIKCRLSSLATSGDGARQTRPFCDICEQFDLHDTTECPTQEMEIVEYERHSHYGRDKKKAVSRPYCENCEGVTFFIISQTVKCSSLSWSSRVSIILPICFHWPKKKISLLKSCRSIKQKIVSDLLYTGRH